MDARDQDRARLIYNLKVENEMTHDSLGYIVNINPRGMMLISDTPTVAPATAGVRIQLPRNVMAGEWVSADAEIRWCRERTAEEYYIGIRFVAIPKDSQLRIADLIDRFQQEEGFEEETSDPYLRNMDLSEISE